MSNDNAQEAPMATLGSIACHVHLSVGDGEPVRIASDDVAVETETASACTGEAVRVRVSASPGEIQRVLRTLADELDAREAAGDPI